MNHEPLFVTYYPISNILLLQQKWTHDSGLCIDLIFHYFYAKVERPIKGAGEMPRTCGRWKI